MRPLRSACVLSVSLLFSAAQGKAQVPTEHPELIAGPWEVASASRINGICFEIVTSSSGPTGREHFDWQSLNIRVYHREGGKETWGYFATKDKASPESYSMQDDHTFTLFDGERLRIHFIDATDIKPFDLDITFSAASPEWTGTWSRSGQSFNVVLKRPAPNPGVTPRVFVGDWAGDSAPNSPLHLAPGTLHIRESLDGVLSAWLDRTISGMDPKTRSIHNDQRNGEWLKVNSTTDTGLVLDTNPNAMGPPSQFRGSLSEDHQVLTGVWERTDGGGLNAPDRFRRTPSPAVDPFAKSGEQAIPSGAPNNAGSTGDSCTFDFEPSEISNCIRQTSTGELVIGPQVLTELDFDSYGLPLCHPLTSQSFGE